MTGANITNLVIGVAVLVLFVSRQLTTARQDAAGQLPVSDAV